MGLLSRDEQPVPPDCGRRLLPVVIDQIARDDPERAWAALPYDDNDLTKGFEFITFVKLVNAIDRLAWFITDKFGGKSSTFETILYLGKADIRYFAVQMACVKAGYKPLFSSHVNSLPIHVSLMKQLECSKVLSASGVFVDDIVNAKAGTAHHVIPELDDLFSNTTQRVERFPYTKTFEEAKFEPYVVVHSSGTTGDPKPVIHNHASLMSLDATRLLPDVEDRKRFLGLVAPGFGVSILTISSPYHSLAQSAWTMTVFGGGIYYPGFRYRAAEPSEVYGFLDNANITRGVLLPWIMEDIARHPQGEKYMKQLDLATFGGGVLSPFAGEIWSKHTRIQNIWASTEVLMPPQLECPSEDHEYVSFDVVYSGAEFRPISTTEYVDGMQRPLHELVFKLTPRSAEFGAVGISTYHARMGIQHNNDVDDVKKKEHAGGGMSYPEHKTGDLWTQHPDPAKAHFVWRFAGRKDDLITLTSGINLHPTTLEKAITSHPAVGGAVIVGSGHQQPIALIEAVEGVSPDSPDAEGLWKAAVSLANEHAPAHGVVAETHVIAVPAGSFMRTPKGTVMRKKTIAAFEGRAEEVYRRFGDKYQSGEHRIEVAA